MCWWTNKYQWNLTPRRLFFFLDFEWNPLGCLRAPRLSISWSCRMLLKTMKTFTTTNALLIIWCRFCQNSNHFLCADTFRNLGNKRDIESRLADGPININRKLPAGDAFGFRDAFGMLPEYFQMLLIAFGMLYPCAGDTIRKNERKERRTNKGDTQ